MGNFKIEIVAVGGHGCDRTARRGEPIAHAHVVSDTGLYNSGGTELDMQSAFGKLLEAADPDCVFRALAAAMAQRGMLDAPAARSLGMASPALLTHWPHKEKIVDDIAGGVRVAGQFGIPDDEAAMAAYARYAASAGGKSLITGAKLPDWYALSSDVKLAWIAAANPAAPVK